MRVIGATEAGAMVMEVTKAEFARLAAGRASLLEVCEVLGTLAPVPAPAARACRAVRPVPPVRKARTAAKPKAKAAAKTRDKLCVVCGTAFRDETRTNSRKFCGEGGKCAQAAQQDAAPKPDRLSLIREKQAQIEARRSAVLA